MRESHSARSRQALAGLVAFAATLLISAPAEALTLSGAVARPDNTDAGAHSRFHLHLDIGSGDDIKDLTTELPPGLIGNPQAQPKCQRPAFLADNCPSATQVGTTTAAVTATVAVVPVPLTVPGSIYNLVANSGEPARLGIVLRPAGGLLPKLFQEATISLRSDFGLNTTIAGFPTEASGIPTHVDSLDILLNASFMTNPTSCAVATTRFVATSYSAPSTPVIAQDSFTPTACLAQPFSPQVSLEIDGGTEGSHPTVTSTITQQVGEANQRRVQLTLPAGLAGEISRLSAACPEASFDAGTCPETAAVGTATAISPLLDSPLSGAVYLIQTAAPVPGVGLDLKGTLPIKLKGTNALTGSELRLQTVFDGLPDQPLTTFRLVFPGGPNGLLVATQDLCSTRPGFTAIIDSQGGHQVTRQEGATLTGCGDSQPPPSGGQGRCAGQRATKVGTNRRDVLRGTAGRDVIAAKGGNDLIRGLAGNDLVCGGAGKDRLLGGGGKDTLLGGPGGDLLVGGGGRDVLRGGKGTDRQRQ